MANNFKKVLRSAIKSFLVGLWRWTVSIDGYALPLVLIYSSHLQTLLLVLTCSTLKHCFSRKYDEYFSWQGQQIPARLPQSFPAQRSRQPWQLLRWWILMMDDWSRESRKWRRIWLVDRWRGGSAGLRKEATSLSVYDATCAFTSQWWW